MIFTCGVAGVRWGRGPDLGAHFGEPYDGLGDEAGDGNDEAKLANLLRNAGELDLRRWQST